METSTKVVVTVAVSAAAIGGIIALIAHGEKHVDPVEEGEKAALAYKGRVPDMHKLVDELCPYAVGEEPSRAKWIKGFLEPRVNPDIWVGRGGNDWLK